MIRIKSKNLTIPQNRYFKTEKDADNYATAFGDYIFKKYDEIINKSNG